MTENERMSISGLLDVLNTGIALTTCHMEYAIQSNVLEDLILYLEEIQQYRAIGTVEDWQKLIKKEATERRKLEEYFMFGSVEEFKALKEKNEPKKPNESVKNKIGYYHCPNPNCKRVIGTSIITRIDKYCADCGQALADY